MPKRFTLEQAQALLPLVSRLLREAEMLKPEFQAAGNALRSATERIMMMGGVNVDRGSARELKTRYESAASRIRSAVEQIQETGCLVKDLDAGLVDFPTLYRGDEVYLCWKADEPQIGFWHRPEEGFAGRKPIDDDFRANHAGDGPETSD